jgi:hypothetical protein
MRSIQMKRTAFLVAAVALLMAPALGSQKPLTADDVADDAGKTWLNYTREHPTHVELLGKPVEFVGVVGNNIRPYDQTFNVIFDEGGDDITVQGRFWRSVKEGQRVRVLGVVAEPEIDTIPRPTVRAHSIIHLP